MWRLAAGARAVADFRFDDRIEGTDLFFRRSTPNRHDRDVIGDGAREVFCGHNIDGLVQWMVQDASLDRGDRRGPKLT